MSNREERIARGHSVKPNTLDMNRSLLHTHIIPALGSKKLADEINVLIHFFRQMVKNVSKKYHLPLSSFRTSILDDGQMEEMIISHEHFKENYYTDSEKNVFLKRNYRKVNNDLILLDGSNIASEGINRGDGNPARLKQLVSTMEKLNERFPPIQVLTFIDAFLPHKIDDKKALNQLIHEGKIKKVPSGSDADDFLLRLVKEKKALIVTNDTFNKDWKERDKWIHDNIDYFRVSFMFHDNEIILQNKIDELLM